MRGWKKVRLVGAFLVGIYLADMYVGMGLVKFDPDGFWTPAFERWGYPVWLRVAVGIAEVGGGIALLVPWIAAWGAGLVALVMAGAITTRALDGRWVDVSWNVLYLTMLVWIAFEWWGWRRPRRRTSAAE